VNTNLHFIEAVRLVPGPGTKHDHIGFVRLTDGTVLARATVVRRILNGDQFYTAAKPPARVYVHSCPHCGARDYITTHPDATPTNNLLNLPKF
jgi:hypothetical protein